MSMDARKFVAAAAIVSALLVVGFAGVTRVSLGKLEQDLEVAEQRLGGLRELIEATSAPSPEPGSMPELEPLVPSWQLLAGPEIVETLQSLQRIGDTVGVAFDEQKALNSADTGKQSFTVSGRGAPAAVCAFLAGIETSTRLMIVETGRVTPGGGDQVAFTLGVGTYHEGGRR